MTPNNPISPEILREEIKCAREVVAVLQAKLAEEKPSISLLKDLCLARFVVLDKIISWTVQSAKSDGHTVPCDECRSGKCCIIGVDATPADGFLVAAFLDHTKKLNSLLDKLKERHLSQAAAVSVDDWYDKAVPCLFLDETSKRCTIYPYRPAACRTHFTLSDPTLCGTGNGAAVTFDRSIMQIRTAPYDQLLQTQLGIVGDGLSTLPGAVWAFGKNLWCRDNFTSFKKRVKRDWLVYNHSRESLDDRAGSGVLYKGVSFR